MINLVETEPSAKSCIVLNGVRYNIGADVRCWDHPGGFNGYVTKAVKNRRVDNKTGKTIVKVVKGRRYSKRRRLGNPVDSIKQLFIHHSGGDGEDPSSMYRTLYMERGLSVHFACEDDGRIWQFNDMVDSCWHAGKHNKISVGVEMCLFPLVNRRPRYYDEERCARTGNLPHDVGVDTIHGRKMDVFMMPELQWKALSFLYAAAWVAIGHQRTKGFEGPFDDAPKFPRVSGEIPRTVVPDGRAHVGLFTHFMATKRKIDPCGFPPFDVFERDVANHYSRFRSALG